ncbi:RND family efflux transporter, MFP subunit [Desulfonatronum thiosulfatophilum]|uniref:RND family efflux transporter, MFP subunit n=1 Tax=Desulfonatronum thiosulfatophilum TaxID=617002 RepID=A0A1G6DJJ8_9BACT|nr:efflux RND transporter periplasmic adaptor subunit [Desulfonatronum thiosulfatophilum]SDB45281.1 RND family efflux transporter, MFP subunit [Desulfonatronum thiosulfatophilum]
MRFRMICSVLLGLALMAGAVVLTFRPEPISMAAEPKYAAKVHVDPVVVASVTRESRFTAITQPYRQAILSFTVPGKITSRPVQVGDRVQADQALANLGLREFDNAVDQAKAAAAELTVQLGQAERDHLRFSRLSSDNVVEARQAEQATALMDQLQAALAGATAQLAEALRRRDESWLLAPFSGVVTAVYLEPGEWADPGRPVLELQDDHRVKLEVEVPENIIIGLEPGQSVHATLPFAGNVRVNGRIAHLARAAGGSGRLFPVVVELESESGLVPGMTAELVLDVKSRPAFAVPLSAVINPGGARPSLFILTDGRARQVFVGLEGFSADKVIVTGDIVGADLVVVHGQTILTDGQSVDVAP